jgi:xylose isomerase
LGEKEEATMADTKSYHSVCRWTFHAGKGGFVPDDMIPRWGADSLDTVGVIDLIKKEIAPRLPETVELGIELHYDNEVNEKNVGAVTDALVDARIRLAMITPGAHKHFAYGGIASLDPEERSAAEMFGERALDIAYAMKKAWHPDPAKYPAFVLWNGSWGYDLASVGIRKMYQNLKESVARLARAQSTRGGDLFMAFEPKPNEGHPALLVPTVASAALLWRRIADEYGISLCKKGVNKEFGHSEMIGLDHVLDTVEEIDSGMLVHMHLNSQGYNDGIILGGPGKYDIDHGVRVNGMNIAVASLIRTAGYARWKGHDMQVRPYDDERHGIDRVVRSILSWEAVEAAAEELDEKLLLSHLENRDTAKAEDMIRGAVVRAQERFDLLYAGGR